MKELKEVQLDPKGRNFRFTMMFINGEKLKAKALNKDELVMWINLINRRIEVFSN